jgi:tetratricopeptide (TPR) repeat protein
VKAPREVAGITAMMIPLPTASGELPKLYELDPLRFQGLCRDLFQSEPNIATAEVFGVPGQLQRGIDVLAMPREGENTEAGQCKCVKPSSVTAALIKSSADEFFKHEPYWKERRLRRFILFLASDATERKVQEEAGRQRQRFQAAGIAFELWSAAVITNKLRPHPGLVRHYLHQVWEKVLCGSGISGFPVEHTAVNSVLATQIESLASHLAQASERELETIRDLFRRGRKNEAAAGLRDLREASRWQALPPLLKAKTLRLQAQLLLEVDVPHAKQLADQARALDPAGSSRIAALIAYAEGNIDAALAAVRDDSDPQSKILFGSLILETGDVDRALAVLESIAGVAEAHRVKALAFLRKQDLTRARLEVEKAVDAAPNWMAAFYTRAMVFYLSGLSPVVLRRGIPQWPEPLDWNFVKVDDESRRYFQGAIDAISVVEKEAELGVEERRMVQAWHLASLANDPERRDEATKYCATRLQQDSVNYRLVAWAVARRLQVDLAGSIADLNTLHENRKASVGQVITLIVWHLSSSNFTKAKEVLERGRDVFEGAGAHELWLFWNSQIGAAAGESVASEEPLSPAGTEEKLVRLRAAASQTGNWEPLLKALRERVAGGDGEALYELASLLASLEKWEEAVQLAAELPRVVETAEALRLACVILYNARQYESCLTLLDVHRHFFPHSEILPMSGCSALQRSAD